MKNLCIATLLAGASLQAHAVGKLADVSIIDQRSGEVLQIHEHHGEYWVAGSPGARYAISVRNHLGERLLAVTSVDGVNVVSGETAGWNQTGYVFGGWQSYPITGWRKSQEQVAAFEFSAAPRSYAARTGRPKNVGVIGVALFREREYAPPALAKIEAQSDRAKAANEAPAPSADTSRESRAESVAGASHAPRPAPRLGTAHGRRQNSYVEYTDFQRAQSSPDEVIRIRYDSYDNLLAMGVIHRPRIRPETPQAFPQTASSGFVPDPR
jgi:hypothetical protein